MLAAIRSEWTKTFTLPSVWITTGVLFAVFLFFQYQIFEFYAQTGDAVQAGTLTTAEGAAALRGDLEPSIFNPGILLVVLGSIIAGAEFRTGQFGMSVVAVPNRAHLMLGKIITSALYVLAFGLVWIVLAIVIALAAGGGVGLAALWGAGLFPGMARIMLFLLVFTLFPLALTLITRRTLTGIVSAMVLIMLTMAQVVALASPLIDAFLPLSAARNLLLQGTGNPVPLTSGALQGGLVLTGWAVVTIAVALITVTRRDAR